MVDRPEYPTFPPEFLTTNYIERCYQFHIKNTGECSCYEDAMFMLCS